MLPNPNKTPNNAANIILNVNTASYNSLCVQVVCRVMIFCTIIVRIVPLGCILHSIQNYIDNILFYIYFCSMHVCMNTVVPTYRYQVNWQIRLKLNWVNESVSIFQHSWVHFSLGDQQSIDYCKADSNQVVHHVTSSRDTICSLYLYILHTLWTYLMIWWWRRGVFRRGGGSLSVMAWIHDSFTKTTTTPYVTMI